MTAPAGWPDAYPWPPCHPTTGEPFVDTHLVNATDRRLLSYPRSDAPGPMHIELDDDGEIVEERERTPEEMADLTAAYERALEKWKKTGGRFVERGPTVIDATFTTATGATAEATWNAQANSWHWKRADGPKCR